MATCRKCPAKIWWCQTLAGEWMPVDQKPNPKGNLIILDRKGEDGQTIVATADLFTPTDRTRYMPHWATCPAAKEFRS